jgi:hypothetical protein
VLTNDALFSEISADWRKHLHCGHCPAPPVRTNNIQVGPHTPLPVLGGPVVSAGPGESKPVVFSKFAAEANEDNRFDILDLHSHWLVDTGCGKDFTPRSLVGEHEEVLADADPIELHTANGHYSTTKTLSCAASGRSSLDVDSYLAKDTPCVVSIGERRMKHNSKFIWLDWVVPRMVLPDMQIVPFDVIGDVAYMLEGGVHSTCRARDTLAALCGVRASDTRIELPVSRCFAAAPTGSSSDSAVVAGDPSADELAGTQGPAAKDSDVATEYFRVGEGEDPDKSDADSTGVPSEGTGVPSEGTGADPESKDDEAPAHRDLRFLAKSRVVRHRVGFCRPLVWSLFIIPIPQTVLALGVLFVL